MRTAIIFTNHTPASLAFCMGASKHPITPTRPGQYKATTPEAYTAGPMLKERPKATAPAVADSAEANEIISRILEGRTL
jgi:hypothetical protein